MENSKISKKTYQKHKTDEIQQIGVLTFSRQKNYNRWVIIGLLLILIFFLIFAALSESKPNKTLNTPKTAKTVNNPPKKV